MNRKGFMVMLGVILINTILAILVVVLGIVFIKITPSITIKPFLFI